MADETSSIGKRDKKMKKVVENEGSIDQPEPLEVESKERKKKNKTKADLKDEGAHAAKDDKKKKRKRKDVEVESEETRDNLITSKKRKKDKKREQLPDQSENVQDVLGDMKGEGKKEKRSKKSKSSDKDQVESVFSESATPSTPLKEKKKKSKRKYFDDNLPNPAEDETLSDKSRGALTYTWTRVAAPEDWKFNKAHQNWIVRHVFSTDLIPDKYFNTIVSYLQGCKGGVRENLLKVCQDNLSTVDKPAGEVASDPTTETAVEGRENAPATAKAAPIPLAIQEEMRKRSRTLLDALRSQDNL